MKDSYSYSELLKDPRWQKRRLEILSRDEFTCQSCWKSDEQLHVHHKYYISGRMPWEYPNFCLITLCWQCHEMQFDFIRQSRASGEFSFEPWENHLENVDADYKAMEAQFKK